MVEHSVCFNSVKALLSLLSSALEVWVRIPPLPFFDHDDNLFLEMMAFNALTFFLWGQSIAP